MDLREANEWLLDCESSPEERIVTGECVMQMWKVVERLSKRQRTVFTLRYGKEHDLGEIARATGLHESSVKAHLWRAVTCRFSPETARKERNKLAKIRCPISALRPRIHYDRSRPTPRSLRTWLPGLPNYVTVPIQLAALMEAAMYHADSKEIKGHRQSN